MITKREIIIAMKLHFCLFYSIVKISTVEIKARFLFAIHKMVNLSFLHCDIPCTDFNISRLLCHCHLNVTLEMYTC